MIIGGHEVRYAPKHGIWHNWRNTAGVRTLGAEDSTARTHMVRHVVLHTTRGLPKAHASVGYQTMPGKGPKGIKSAVALSRWWRKNGSAAGAHVVISQDGSVLFLADLLDEVAYHAPPLNSTSIGIELVQSNDGLLYQAQLDAMVEVVDVITAVFEIRRSIPEPYSPLFRGPGQSLQYKLASIRALGGVWGHRDITTRRSYGDPGDAVFSALGDNGYTTQFSIHADFNTERTALSNLLGTAEITGLTPQEVDYRGRWRDLKGGSLPSLWVTRPIDYNSGVTEMLVVVRDIQSQLPH